MFAKRNSLTLAVVWLMLLTVGIVWYTKDARQLVDVLEQEKKIKKSLATSQAQIARLTQVETMHEKLSEQWSDSPKRIISAEEPAFTLSYINWIVSSNELDIYYDFVLNEKIKSGDYTKFVYTLTGEGTYNDINKMIWCLTYEPILYKINNITLRRSNENSELLRFNLKLQGFTVESQIETAEDFNHVGLSSIDDYQDQHDIFEPLVRLATAKRSDRLRNALPPKQPGQIDVEKASLKAVTNNSVFLSEGNTGLIELKVGDEVYLGRLIDINQEVNEAQFLINKSGKSQRITLRINERD